MSSLEEAITEAVEKAVAPLVAEIALLRLRPSVENVELLRVRRAARRLAVSENYLRSLITLGLVRAVRVGRVLRVSSSEVARVAAEGTTKTQAPPDGEEAVIANAVAKMTNGTSMSRGDKREAKPTRTEAA